MRAQGLSVSFVVVAALAILVLVLGVAFLMGAFSSQRTTASMQQAKSACNTLCSNIQSAMQSKDCTTGSTKGDACVKDKASSEYSKYCGASFSVAGSTYTCTQLTNCVVNDVYGNPITIDCTSYSTGNTGNNGNQNNGNQNNGGTP